MKSGTRTSPFWIVRFLIIDDLGTEVNNSLHVFPAVLLYQRPSGKQPFHNYFYQPVLNMLRDNYTDRVTSRIISGYRIIPLYGEDLRRRKLGG